MAKKKGARLSDFQFARFARRRRAASASTCARFDPGVKPFSSGSKAADLVAIDALASDIDRLQDVLLRRPPLQASRRAPGHGRRGQGRHDPHVFSKTRPRVRAAWKEPTPTSWPTTFCGACTRPPAAGEIVIFNRSHYEDVLVTPVKGSIRPASAARFAQINDFERLLAEAGTVVLKFLLRLSRRSCAGLPDRLHDPTKRWKFAAGDLTERSRPDAYQAAYATALAATAHAVARRGRSCLPTRRRTATS